MGRSNKAAKKWSKRKNLNELGLGYFKVQLFYRNLFRFLKGRVCEDL